MKIYKNVVIVGGGTAGWLTALYCQHKLKNANITLIESSSIGILGAGEGTTPHFVEFLRTLGISIEDIIVHAKGTIKNGILFSNWNGDGKDYFHPFVNKCDITNNDFLIHQAIIEQKNIDELNYSCELSRLFKVKFRENDKKVLPLDSGFALHFDARLLAAYLKSVGLSRGIKLIDGNVQKVIGSGEIIQKLILDNLEEVDTDFVFDCSGLSRILIGKYFNSKWVSYKKSIPNNRAIPFFIENHTGPIPPYTESIAMKYGWIWKIPVQGRFGCGYVFDSNLVSDDEVKKEIIEKFGEVNFPTVFNFEAGCYKEIYRGNCLAVGLSAGFIEPLEATSIYTSIITLTEFFNNSFLIQSQNLRKKFNNYIYSFNEEILSFIYFHYMTKRADSDYWKNFHSKNVLPDLINDWNKLSTFNDFINKFQNAFSRNSILTVGVGIEFFNKDISKDLIEKNTNSFESQIKEYKNCKELVYSKALDHNECIEKIKG